VSLVLRVAYDGTDFHGFARQPGLRTVQGLLESALSEIYADTVLTRGASRTDAGVHALGQIVAFDARGSIPPAGLVRALAGALPPDVVVTAAWEQAGLVEPRFHNLGKRYRYRIRNARLRDPLRQRYEWLVPGRLDLSAMRDAAAHLVGEHDFASFRAADCQARSTVRRVTRISVECRLARLAHLPDKGALEQAPQIVEVEVEGGAFLKNMVRIVVGTLVEVGLGRRAPLDVFRARQAVDRARAGPTAPPGGLTLLEVLWPAPGGPDDGAQAAT
jgi:tRNA pseudouridine38-40 synthase